MAKSRQSKRLRDYYTHLDTNEPRSITTKDVIEFIENTLLGLIWPSSILQRTLLIGQYQVYTIWAESRNFVEVPRATIFPRLAFGGTKTVSL
jgi:hypothetical protein